MFGFVDYRITRTEIENLIKAGIMPIKVPKCSNVYEAVNGHPDIQLNLLKSKSDTKIIIQKEISQEFRNILTKNNIKYIVSKNCLKEKYPSDIILNAFVTENYFIHNTKYTDPEFFLSQKNKKIINVSQGYTKCSVLPVTETAFITSDKGIFNALKPAGFDILLLPPGDISLPGLNYGFIGGCGGMISNNLMAFFGNLNFYKYGNQVIDFLKKYNISPVYLKDGPLSDRGSLLVI